jgi:uncharacterized protein YbjT (DUF2867 family)
VTKHILVTGSTGYIASRLIPQLLERGHRVRALARRPHLLHARSWFGQVDVVQGDVMDPASLAPALKDVDTAYYLVHNMTSGSGYARLETQAAQNFARAAEEAGVRHIIYLGGLADHRQGIATHLGSRIETGASLRQGRVPVTEFRAGIIAGSGSISFEMIRFTTEFFPVIPAPAWLKNKSQPIAVQNIMDYLLAALEHWDGYSRVYEIGGPHITDYLELMLKYARVRGHKRSFILFPHVPVWLMAFGVRLMTPVPYTIAHALVGGLSHDSVVMHHQARESFPQVQLVDFESAARTALERLHPLRIERVWEGGTNAARALKHEGFFIEHRQLQMEAAPEKIFQVITSMGGENGWPFANRLWKLRGWLDGRPFTPAPSPPGTSARKGGEARTREKLQVGDRIDYYVVEALDPDHLLLLHSQLKAPGEGWMEWRVTPQGGGTRLTQTAYFAPRGLPGFLYWIFLYPFHAYVFRGLIRAIARRAMRA